MYARWPRAPTRSDGRLGNLAPAIGISQQPPPAPRSQPTTALRAISASPTLPTSAPPREIRPLPSTPLPLKHRLFITDQDSNFPQYCPARHFLGPLFARIAMATWEGRTMRSNHLDVSITDRSAQFPALTWLTNPPHSINPMQIHKHYASKKNSKRLAGMTARIFIITHRFGSIATTAIGGSGSKTGG